MPYHALVGPLTVRGQPILLATALAKRSLIAVGTIRAEVLLRPLRSIDIIVQPINSDGAHIDRATAAEVRAKLTAFVTN